MNISSFTVSNLNNQLGFNFILITVIIGNKIYYTLFPDMNSNAVTINLQEMVKENSSLKEDIFH